MKKALKKVLSLTLALLLVCSMLPAASAAGTGDNWVSAWSTSPISASLSELGVLDDLGVTVAAVSSRVTVQPTASGSQVRLTFSNEYGLLPLTISSCTVAKTGSNSKTIISCTLKQVRFNGRVLKSIPAGKTLTSDPIDMQVTAGENLTVTTYYRGINTMRTIGLIGGDSYVAIGNYTHLRSMAVGIPMEYTADSGAYEVIPSLKEIDVNADAGTSTCVIFGDSTVANEIPRMLENRLQASGITNVSVTQEAIKGNRLVADGVGKAANLLGSAGIKRFERDVLQQAGVDSVIVKLGINDVVHPYCASKKDVLSPVPLDEMIAGYIQLIEMAHAQGVKIYFCELAPWKGYTRNVFNRGDDVQWTPEIDQLRVDINAWFQSSDCRADGYIALDGLANPADPFALLPAYTTDGIHHTPAGQKAFTDLIPLDLFR